MRKNEFPKKCRQCKYFVTLDGYEHICDYINIEKEPRGCSITEDCDRFRQRGKNTNDILFL